MKKTGRPVSPHVTIYAFPITALSSITNRATGMCLSFGCISLGTVEILGGSGSAMSLMESIGSSSVFLAAPAKFAVTFPLIYHYCGAVRHTMWDKNPEMLTNEDTAKSSYAIFGGSLLVSVGAMFL
jgi:succinate dehydrogenase (ubiquinone) cytochrome b560 subunit